MLNLYLFSDEIQASARNQLTFDTKDSLINDVMIDDLPTPSAIGISTLTLNLAEG